MAGMRRAGQRVRFGKVVGLAFFRARRVHGRNCDGRVLERRPPTDLVLRSRAEARRLEARLQLSTPSAPTGASFEALRGASGRGGGVADERLALSAPAGSSLLSTADQMAAATSSSLLSASMTTQRSGSAAAMSRNARRKVW